MTYTVVERFTYSIDASQCFWYTPITELKERDASDAETKYSFFEFVFFNTWEKEREFLIKVRIKTWQKMMQYVLPQP
jgi:hypothetical protein